MFNFKRSFILFVLFSLIIASSNISIAANSSLLITQNIDLTVKKIIQEILKPLQTKGEVVKVKGNQVYLNIGSKNVKKGQQFRIIGLGEELIDPSTNISLGFEQHYRCTVEIIEVTDYYSIGEVVGELTEVIQEKDQALPMNSNYKLAVTQFTLPSNNSITANEAIYLQEKLIIALSREANISVVERDQLDRVLEEYKLSSSGLIDESTATELGRLLGVNALIIGNFVSWGEDHLELTAKMVDIQTGIILSAAQIQVTGQEVAEETATEEPATAVAKPEVVEAMPVPAPAPVEEEEEEEEVVEKEEEEEEVTEVATNPAKVIEDSVDEEGHTPVEENNSSKNNNNSTQVNVVVVNQSQETATPAPVPASTPVSAEESKPKKSNSLFTTELETGLSYNLTATETKYQDQYAMVTELTQFNSYLIEGVGFYGELNMWPFKWLGLGAGYDLTYSAYAEDTFDQWNNLRTTSVESTLQGPYTHLLLKLGPVLTLKAGAGYYFSEYSGTIQYPEATTDFYRAENRGDGLGYLLGVQLTTPPIGRVSIFADAVYRQGSLTLNEVSQSRLGEEEHNSQWPIVTSYFGFRFSGGFAIHF